MPPRYMQIRNELLRRIEGNFYSDRQLPPEIVLAQEFQVNRNTLRRSIGDLEKLGVVWRIPGKGTFLYDPGHSPEKKVSFNFRLWSGSIFCQRYRELAENYRRLFDEFSRRYPWVKVNIEFFQLTNSSLTYHPELMDCTHPTVCLLNYAADHARLGHLLSLEKFLELEDYRHIDPRLLMYHCGPDGKRGLYTIPFATCVGGAAFRKDFFETAGESSFTPPETWEELLMLVEKLKEKNLNFSPIELEFLLWRGSMSRYLPYFWNGETEENLLSNTPELNPEKWRNALEFFKKLYPFRNREGEKTPPALKLASLPHTFDDKWQFFPYPRLSREHRHITYLNPHMLGFSSGFAANASLRKVIPLLVRFILEPEIQLRIFRDFKLMPARTGLFSAMEKCDPEMARICDYGSKYGITAFDMPESDELHETLHAMSVHAAAGISSVSAAVREAQEKLAAGLSPVSSR